MKDSLKTIIGVGTAGLLMVAINKINEKIKYRKVIKETKENVKNWYEQSGKNLWWNNINKSED